MSKHGRTRAHVYVSGRVQDVYYRVATRDTARDRDIDGWVRNLSDGRAEAVFESPRDDVEAMVKWCHKGSPMTTVEDVDVTFEEPDDEAGFRIER